MGKREAELDGIEYYYDKTSYRGGRRGSWIFLIPCDVCGTKVKRKSYGRNTKTICDACKLGVKKKKDAIANAWLDEIETKGEHRFNQALDEIQAQVKDFDSYANAVRIAGTAKEKYGSIPEAMVAVELIRLGYSVIPQQKVGRYHVDFYLPNEKIVLEVDGGTFHRNNRNSDREATIQISFGMDAKIIHVSAELIRKNIQKLSEYIEKSLQLP